MIIYIHGFGSSGKGGKAIVFRKYFNSIEEDFIAPSLSYNPELAISTLEDLINSCKQDVYLIGSSLGGYYSLYLSQNKNVKKVVLINPSVNPVRTLSSAIGNAQNFYDGSYFSWQKQHLELLEKYETTQVNKFKILLLSQKDDEVLDYSEAVKKLDGCEMIVEEGGNHSFEGIQRHFTNIKNFILK